jgi:predicted HNH restriction endonuclease
MKVGHVIYAKSGENIVGRGVVREGILGGAYWFNPRSPIRDPQGERWPHLISVNWDHKFRPVEMFVGDQQRYTIRPLSITDLARISRAQLIATKSETRKLDLEAYEGRILIKQARFRARNRTLIDAIKATSDYRCVVCGFQFEDVYGAIGSEFIIAHHVEPLSGKRGETLTTPSDVALLCANCHAMIHTQEPPLRPRDLRRKLKGHRAR